MTNEKEACGRYSFVDLDWDDRETTTSPELPLGIDFIVDAVDNSKYESLYEEIIRSKKFKLSTLTKARSLVRDSDAEQSSSSVKNWAGFRRPSGTVNRHTGSDHPGVHTLESDPRRNLTKSR